MALFKETLCEHCGNRAKLFSRIDLDDDKYICKKCVDKFPDVMAKELTGHSYDEFLTVYNYIHETNPELKKQFRETHSYSGIHLDTKNDLFYVDGYKPTVYFKVADLDEFDLHYTANEVQEGLLGAKAIGNVYLKIRIDKLMFFVDKVLESNVSANVKSKGLMNKKYVYDNPKGMDDFLQHFEGSMKHVNLEGAKYILAHAEQILNG